MSLEHTVAGFFGFLSGGIPRIFKLPVDSVYMVGEWRHGKSDHTYIYILASF